MRRQHDDDLLVEQVDELESVRVERPAQERHIESAGPQAGHRFDGVLAMENEPQVRQMRRDQRTQSGKDPNIGGGKRADGQIAGASAGCLLGKPSRMIEASENVFRLAQEHPTGVRQRHVMAAPLEQRDADFSFKLTDLLAERRLRGVEPRGGARKVQFVRDRHEVPQMTQFHHAKATIRYLSCLANFSPSAQISSINSVSAANCCRNVTDHGRV